MFDEWMEECPCCSVLLNIVTFACLILTIWAAEDKTERDGLAPRDIAALPAVLFLLLYAFYLVECYKATTHCFLSIVKEESAKAYIDRIRKQPPVILFKATGWHYEQKQKTIPFRDGRGKRRERVVSHQERVVTFQDSETFSFAKWTDVTEIPEGIEDYSLISLRFTKSFKMADEKTQTLFTNLSHAFQARNRHRDRYVDYEEELVIDGFEDHVIAYVDPLDREWWIVVFWYWFFSVILMSWFYRWLLVRRTGKLPVAIKKEVDICM